MTLNAGVLNRRVTIQQLVAGVDPIGQPTDVWTDLATVFASIKTPTGSSAIHGGADIAINRMSVRIRYRDDVTEGMRMLYKGDILNIEAVLPDTMGKIYTDVLVEQVK